ncbi:hypothetical protein RRSWK_06404 [Rhodopirellula sp. SWK7]|nr:hypothetical protein RRSWK_06404 [Rhodopirellula sp. SWK7]
MPRLPLKLGIVSLVERKWLGLNKQQTAPSLNPPILAKLLRQFATTTSNHAPQKPATPIGVGKSG